MSAFTDQSLQILSQGVFYLAEPSNIALFFGSFDIVYVPTVHVCSAQCYTEEVQEMNDVFIALL